MLFKTLGAAFLISIRKHPHHSQMITELYKLEPLQTFIAMFDLQGPSPHVFSMLMFAMPSKPATHKFQGQPANLQRIVLDTTICSSDKSDAG